MTEMKRMEIDVCRLLCRIVVDRARSKRLLLLLCVVCASKARRIPGKRFANDNALSVHHFNYIYFAHTSSDNTHGGSLHNNHILWHDVSASSVCVLYWQKRLI